MDSKKTKATAQAPDEAKKTVEPDVTADAETAQQAEEAPLTEAEALARDLDEAKQQLEKEKKNICS